MENCFMQSTYLSNLFIFNVAQSETVRVFISKKLYTASHFAKLRYLITELDHCI